MNIFRDIEQGSPEWIAIRKGHPTASRFSDIITAAKGELSNSSTGYIRELIGESFCPDWEEWLGNKFTDRGKETEPEARDAFATILDGTLRVEEVGFVLGDDGVCGCSPDGLIYKGDLLVSGVEIKCPSPKVHVGYVLDGGLPLQYKAQVHGSMAITGLPEWHFWSFFPGLRPHHVVVKRDDFTTKLEVALGQFVTSYKAAYADALPKLQLPIILTPFP